MEKFEPNKNWQEKQETGLNRTERAQETIRNMFDSALRSTEERIKENPYFDNPSNRIEY